MISLHHTIQELIKLYFIKSPYITFTLFFIITFLISRIPFIGKYIRVYYTLIHEAGHAFMALVTSGKVLRIELFADTSGTTLTQSSSKLKSFFISIIGYPFAAITGFLGFYFMSKSFVNWFFIINFSIAAWSLLFAVRNTYGVFWLVTAVLLFFAVFYFGNTLYQLLFAFFISTLLLTESIVASFQLLKLAWINPQNAGDATNLKKMAFFPAFLWAFFFFAFSVAAIYGVVKYC